MNSNQLFACVKLELSLQWCGYYGDDLLLVEKFIISLRIGIYCTTIVYFLLKTYALSVLIEDCKLVVYGNKCVLCVFNPNLDFNTKM